MVLLAKSFAQRGYEVHMITLAHGQPDGELIDGIRIWSAHGPNSGIPVFRFVYPRTTGLLQALARADCDVYVQSSAGMATGLSAWFCRSRRAAFVYRASHDSNFIPGKQHIRFARDRKLYEYGLRRADVVVAQTRHQQKLLAQNYGLDGDLGGSLVESPAVHLERADRDIDVLWVGRMHPIKRPELALALGRRFSRRRFCIVGGPSNNTEPLFNELLRQSESMENCELLGYRPYHTTQPMFSRAMIFLSTSQYEGFPNTYLQAWIAGTPLIAFYDPDGLIARERLGVVVRTPEEAAQAIESLLNNPDQWREISKRARAYARENHSASVVDRYEDLMAPLFGRH